MKSIIILIMMIASSSQAFLGVWGFLLGKKAPVAGPDVSCVYSETRGWREETWVDSSGDSTVLLSHKGNLVLASVQYSGTSDTREELCEEMESVADILYSQAESGDDPSSVWVECLSGVDDPSWKEGDFTWLWNDGVNSALLVLKLKKSGDSISWKTNLFLTNEPAIDEYFRYLEVTGLYKRTKTKKKTTCTSTLQEYPLNSSNLPQE